MLLERIFHLLVSEEKLERAIYKINNGGDMEDIDTIVNAYFQLAKKMYRKNLHFFRKPKTVELTDSSMVIRIDGETYDFGFIPHNDLRGTGWKMDIEVLYSTDKMRGIVQEGCPGMVVARLHHMGFRFFSSRSVIQARRLARPASVLASKYALV